jgi:hypothetical protein
MKKSTICLLAITLQCLALFSCDDNKINIPEGVYELTEHRKTLVALECGMTEAVFDKSIMVANDTIQTAIEGVQSVKYGITKVGDNTYSVSVVEPLSQNVSTKQFLYNASNNQLLFCNGKIIYQKK